LPTGILDALQEVSMIWQKTSKEQIPKALVQSWAALVLLCFSKDPSLFPILFDETKMAKAKVGQLWTTLFSLPFHDIRIATLSQLASNIPSSFKLQASSKFVSYTSLFFFELNIVSFPSLIFLRVECNVLV
jgi:hypothetical protein